MFLNGLPDNALGWTNIKGLDILAFINLGILLDTSSAGDVEAYAFKNIGPIRAQGIDTTSEGTETDTATIDSVISQVGIPVAVFSANGSTEAFNFLVTEPSADVTLFVRNKTGAALGQYSDLHYHNPLGANTVALTNDQLQTIKTELETDPNGYGYDNGATPDDAGDADLLNLVRDAIQVNRQGVATADVWSKVVSAEYAALSTDDRDYLTALMNLPAVNFGNDDGTNTQTKLSLQTIFPGNTNTGQGLETIYTQDGSRGQQLLGLAVTNITPSDVANARNLP